MQMTTSGWLVLARINLHFNIANSIIGKIALLRLEMIESIKLNVETQLKAAIESIIDDILVFLEEEKNPHKGSSLWQVKGT